jgi:3-hydroxyisobutyrate dehydrogenase-like beta-hydroxyacid dehydrogenase
MAERIAAAGFPLTVWARRAEVLDRFRQMGANPVATVAEMGARTDQVGICVVSDDDVEDIMVRQGLLDSLRPGAIVTIHSTVHPDTCRRLAALGSEKGVHVLDAPVSGGEQAARAGELTVMVGGDADAFEEVLPVIRTYAGLVTRLGAVGSGQIGKLVNNLLFFVNCVTADAALELGSELGLDRPSLQAVLSAGSARSAALDLHDGLFENGRIRASTHAAKDVSLAVEVARQGGASLGVFDSLAKTVLAQVGS